MSDYELLQKVKKNIGLAGSSYHDETISGYIAEVKEYLLDAGVKPKVVNSSVAAGCISRGVNDLWNYGAGNAELSPYFMQRAIQLTRKKEEELPEYEGDGE